METILALLLLVGLVLVVLPIVALALAAGAGRRERELRGEVARLAQRVRELERRGTATAAATAQTAAPPQPAAAAPRPLGTTAVVPPVPPPAPPPARPPVPPPAAEGERYLPPFGAPSVPAPAAASELPPPLPPHVTPRPSSFDSGPAEVSSEQAAARESTRAGVFAGLKGFDWERLVGVRLFSVLAGVVLAIAAIFFIVWSIEAGLVIPPVRFVILTAVGVGLVAASELRVAQGYAITARSLAAGGLVTLFSVFYAGYGLWGFYGALPAFGLLALVTLVAVLLAIRRSSLVVAVLGLVGGFAAPVLVSTGADRTLSLFGYLLLLNVGLAWVAYKRRWTVLPWLSLAFTALYQAGWVAEFLEEPKLPLAFGIFLVFGAVGFAAIRLGARGAPASPGAALAAVPPALLALYLAASPSFASSWPLVLGFVALLAAGLATIAAWQGPEGLHAAGAGLTLATLAVYLLGTFTPGHWPLLAAFVAVLAAIYLGAPLLLARLGRDFRAEGRAAVLAAPLLLAAFVRAAPAETAASPLHFLTPLLALAALLSAWAVLRSDARVHVLSSALALVAVAVWSGFHLDAVRLYPALLAYALLGGLLLGAPLLAERRSRPLSGSMTGPLLLGAMLLLVFLARPLAGAVIGGLAGLTVLAALVQAALFHEAARGRSPLFALAGVVVGFAELALWAATGLVSALLPLLVAAAILSAVAVAGGLLVSPHASEKGPAPAVRFAPYLGLAGHLFLAAVAARRELALPPTTWLAVLGVLDLGFVVAALLRRRAGIMLGAAIATALVLAAHVAGLDGLPPAPTIATGAALGAGALFLAGHLAARRLGIAPRPGLGTSGAAAVVALHFGQLLLLPLGNHLTLALLVSAHLALLAGLLLLAWIAGAEGLALSSAILAGLSGLVLCAVPAADPALAFPPAHGLLVATLAWLVALAYPLLRGARGRREWFPFVAAAVTSALYLLAARKALLALGAGPYIGALPVVQAVLLVPHLRLLLRMERPAERDLRRLALVAASILGLLTVAIPLQLEKQWWTIGWAALAAALAWLWRRVPHRGLLAWAAALFAASFVRLVPFFNLSVFAYEPRSATPIWNWYLYTYLAVAAAHFAGAAFLSRGDDRPWARAPRLSHLAGAAGALLLFFLLNIEIADYWSSPGEELAFRFSAGLGPDLTYTIGWAVFAICLLAAGVALRSRATRIASIALLAVTVLKGFLHDLGSLSGLYRVASLVGLAVSLALVAIVLQRFVLRRPEAPPASPMENP